MKSLVLLACFVFCLLPTQAQSDGVSPVQFAISLSDMQKDLTVGNACEDSERTYIVVYGNLDMNGHKLELMNVRITIISGTIIDEGEIIFSCPNSEIRFEQ